ncbi:hypothetical protein [Jannaschia aquimarina]|uniref:Uncharacterized protein n=1 Tax=Jannaschia aquimarina TaxID=935700 RepID=A0A0D1EH47_9RHOB|nr:hypothetical protein [Jannaschia aquimarina]KIT16994.1 hypothetical protein jaqu_11840 [Jannaschia aquimarina]SNS81051.1 hypothetical protein SAMN05421775_102387 [Jannaschia aquimarina]
MALTFPLKSVEWTGTKSVTTIEYVPTPKFAAIQMEIAAAAEAEAMKRFQDAIDADQIEFIAAEVVTLEHDGFCGSDGGPILPVPTIEADLIEMPPMVEMDFMLG